MWQSGSIRITRVNGIAIYIHLTFGLVILWGAWQGWARYGSGAGAGFGVLAVTLLFASVLLHELGHGLQARAFGLAVRRITLLPIGGLAELAAKPSHPWQELLIALAGPVANLGLAVVLGSIAYLIQPFSLHGWSDYLLLQHPPVLLTLLLYVFWVNVVLFFFNMLPAFPMDGGRVIRAALAILADYELATRIAAWLGRIAALAMAAFGAAGWLLPDRDPNPLLLLVALVVYFGARHEELAVRRRRALVRVEVGDVCRPSEHELAPWDPITRSLLARLQRDGRVMPVVVGKRLLGLLAYSEARRVSGQSPEATVAHAMQTVFSTVEPQTTLWVALQEMTDSQLPVLPVVRNGVFCGTISLDDIQRAWRLSARRRRNTEAVPLSGDSSQ